MNPYAEVLKQLLQYTETKYTTLSQAIDYDMSYISKWVNGARLPASRHADRIHEDMARFFANTAQKQHQEGDLKRIFSFADDGQDHGLPSLRPAKPCLPPGPDQEGEK